MNSKRIIILIFAVIFAFSIAPSVLGTVDEFSDNSAPIAENLEFKTYRDVAITGEVSAVDTDGEKLSFYISEAPVQGELEFSEKGSFKYTPDKGAKGKDCFYYYAVDDDGAVSNKATVTIIIQKQDTDVWYSDLEGEAEHYSALVLAEQEVYVGETIAGEYFFNGDAPVTKGRFLAMCMKLCGAEAIDGVVKTGYVDDSDIPAWVKPYAAAALMTGVLDSSQKEMKAETAITYGEAMVILDSSMNITDVYCDEDDSVLQAFANLSSCRIVSDDAADSMDAELTMGEAAEMLAEAYEILERR